MKNALSLSDPPDYAVLPEKDNDEFVHILVKDGPLKGIVFHYQTLKFGEEFDNGDLPLHFSYNVVTEPSDYDIDRDKELLEETLASILFDIVRDTADKKSTDT
jgi:hypothetical protein